MQSSVRVRLTLLFAGALTVMLIAFGIGVRAILVAEEEDDRAEAARGVIEDPAEEQHLRRIVGTLGIALPLVALVAVGGAYLLARRALRPLEAIAKAARTIHARDLGRRVPTGGGAEIEVLARTLNDLLARLETSVGEVDRFTADAAHELRTPLAAAAGDLEIALRRSPRSDGDGALRESAGAALEELGRLRELIDALLLLARGDAGALLAAREAVDLAALARELIDLYAPVAEDAGLTLALVASSGEPPLAFADRTLASRAMGNLIDNALAFAKSAVTVAVRAVAGNIEVTVADDGPGITDEERARLFKRFHRGDPARRRRARGGFGLGLGIVEAIARAHGGAVSYTPAAAGGSVFLLSLPRETARAA